MLPYLRDRPIVLTRYPDGITGKSFFQKDAPEFAPDWVRTERVYSKDTDRDIDYFVVDDAEMLRYVANMGTIPIHVWSARVPTLERPDWLVLDLDPKGAPFTDVVRVAQAVHRPPRRPRAAEPREDVRRHRAPRPGPARRPVHARAEPHPRPAARRWSSRRSRVSRPSPDRSARAGARCTSTSARTATAARSPRRSPSGPARALRSRARSIGGRSPRASIRPASRFAPCPAASPGARTRWRRFSERGSRSRPCSRGWPRASKRAAHVRAAADVPGSAAPRSPSGRGYGREI